MNLSQYYSSRGLKLPSLAQRVPLYKKAGGKDKYIGSVKQNELLLSYLISQDKPAVVVLEPRKLSCLVLSNPIKPKNYDVDKGITFLTQLFGENLMDYSKLGLKGHNGIDYRTIHINAKGEAPIYASHDGLVVSDKQIQSYTAGIYVKIMSDEVVLDGKEAKVETVYFHLSQALVSLGERVLKGQLIGIGGNSGQFTSGPHLHFGLIPYFKTNNGFYKNSNEYGGAIDPMPYFNDNAILQRGGDLTGNTFYYNGVTIPRNYLDKVNYENR